MHKAKQRFGTSFILSTESKSFSLEIFTISAISSGQNNVKKAINKLRRPLQETQKV